MSCQIFTSKLFPSLKNIQEDLPKSRKVLLKNSLRGKKMKTLKKDLLGLKISQKVSGRKAPRNQINREDSSNCIRQLLEPVCFSYKDQGWKRLWTVISLQNFGWCWTPFESLQPRDSDFKKTKRDALKAKQKQLKRHGLGNRPKATTAPTDDEIEILFDKKLLRSSSPQSLLNTVWLNNMIHFRLRGCKEQKELRWGDIVLKTDSGGKEYLEYFER